MGFSLKLFIREMEEIIARGDLTRGEKVKLLKQVIEEQKRYAEQCGVLK